jgi:hypothetical protein
MQRAFRQEEDAYFPSDGSTVVAQPGDVIAPLHVEIMPAVYYSHSVTGGASAFLATAGSKSVTGLDEYPASDVWTIDQNSTLICTSDDSQN